MKERKQKMTLRDNDHKTHDRIEGNELWTEEKAAEEKAIEKSEWVFDRTDLARPGVFAANIVIMSEMVFA
jgi:hypothetical protein